MEKNINLEENIKGIDKMLSSNLDAINLGLEFIDLQAKKIGENKLLICGQGCFKKEYTFDPSRYVPSDDYDAKINFEDGLQRYITYDKRYLNAENQIVHRFDVHASLDKDWQELEIFIDKATGCTKAISMRLHEQSLRYYPFKEFAISEDEIRIDNDGGQVIDGELKETKRYLWYTTPNNSHWPFFSMEENFEKGPLDEPNKTNHSILGISGGFSIDGDEIPEAIKSCGDNYDESRFTEEFDRLAFALASHPRNKELMFHTLDEFDKRFPGIKDYVFKTFKLYRDLANVECYTPISDSIIQQVIVKKCNFKSGKKLLNIKK